MPSLDPPPDLPAIVLLPGFVGMNMDDDEGRRVWLSPLPIAEGHLATLLTLDPSGAPTEGPGPHVHPNGPLGFIYGRAIQTWRDRGLDVSVFNLECRKSALASVVDLVAFVARITETRPGRKVVLVGHSMGALLAALYPHHDPAWEEKIAAAVFLGGTLAGTFEPVEGITGTHWFLQVLGLGDPTRERGIRRAMSTWPGIYSMLPDPETFPAARAVYDAASWPEDARPPQAWLDEVRDTLRPLVRTSPLRRVMTAQLLSVTSPTVDSLGFQDGQLCKGPRTAAGDGTVPAWTARIGASAAYEVDFPHTFLPNDPKAIQAVIDVVEGRWPNLPELREDHASKRFPEGTSPPVTMATTMVTSVVHRILAGDFTLDDVLWPLLP